MLRLKRDEASGKTSILLELLCSGPVLQGRLLQLMQDIWKDGEVVADWKDAEVVPVPKKGGIQSCDNWHDISLLDVVGKLFAQVILKSFCILQRIFFYNHSVVFGR